MRIFANSSVDVAIRVAIAGVLAFSLSFVWQAFLPTAVATVVGCAVGLAMGMFAVSKSAPNVLPIYRTEVRPDDYEPEASRAEKFSTLGGGPRFVPWWDAPDIKHLHGVPWCEADIPPKRHECWPQTDGWIGLDQTQRCACGAIRGNRFGGKWSERNSRKGKVVA